MPLQTGARLGHFEIATLIGAGGMGEVYKARDTRLNRTVALKILHLKNAQDPGARRRLEHEARTIAALTHPRICTLHDIGHHEGADFLVMEYLEGETLAERLANRGASGLPIAEVLRISVDITEALAAAHRHAIVHRDLKPANIILTSGGPKLLDFGIAKLHDSERASQTLTDAATLAAPATLAGTIVGTPQYLAPEQLTGGDIDARTDIFAFGAILFEMLAGRRAFDGTTTAEVLAAVLAEPPALDDERSDVPPALKNVIAQCLARHPEERWQNARDLTLHLKAIALGSVAASPQAAPSRATARWVAAAVSVAGVIALGAALLLMQRTRPDASPVMLDIAAPPNTSLLTTSASIPAAQFAVAPDGGHVVFVAAGLDGKSMLWLRELATGVTRSLPGTDGAAYPFWSHESSRIGFFAGGQLLRIGLRGDAPVRICQAIDPRGGAWNADDVILFAPTRGPIERVSAVGGVPTPVTSLDTARGEVTHRWPSFLADGNRFVFLARGDQPSLRVAALDGSVSKVVTSSLFSGSVLPSGHLLFQRDRALLAQAFAIDRLELSGEPIVIAPIVGTSSVGQLSASASNKGVLVYSTDLSAPGQLTWFDRQGKVEGTVGPVADHMDFELSPDDRRLLISRVDARSSTADVWLRDLMRGSEARLTVDPTIDASAVWDPTGTQMVFRSNRGGVADSYVKGIGSSEPERVLIRGVSTSPTSWSSDGRTILYNESSPETGWDVRQYSFETNTATAWIATPANEMHGRFSPDGRWIAYSSDESGRWEVYVQRTDNQGERVLVSTTGGFEPRWRRDGKEIFYLTAQRRIMAVPVLVTDTMVQPGAPQTVVTGPIESSPMTLTVANGYRKTYAVTGDGQRFLVNVLAREQSAQTMNVILNWPALLQRQSGR